MWTEYLSHIMYRIIHMEDELITSRHMPCKLTLTAICNNKNSEISSTNFLSCSQIKNSTCGEKSNVFLLFYVCVLSLCVHSYSWIHNSDTVFKISFLLMFSLTNHMNWNILQSRCYILSLPLQHGCALPPWFIFYLPQWNVFSMAAAVSALWHSGASTV